jgi:hypothetical protein
VTGTTSFPTVTDLFATLLRGAPVPWSDVSMLPEEFLRASGEQDLTGLICDRLCKALTALGALPAHEPSIAYLRPNRQWRDELISNVRGLPRWSDRLRLLREVAFPGPAYMLKAYGLAPSSLGAALLPVLYLHRLVSGGWKALAGQK